MAVPLPTARVPETVVALAVPDFTASRPPAEMVVLVTAAPLWIVALPPLKMVVLVNRPAPYTSADPLAPMMAELLLPYSLSDPPLMIVSANVEAAPVTDSTALSPLTVVLLAVPLVVTVSVPDADTVSPKAWPPEEITSTPPAIIISALPTPPALIVCVATLPEM